MFSKEQFTTVTPLSKAIAMVVFIILPFVFFFFGVWYGQNILSPNSIGTELESEVTMTKESESVGAIPSGWIEYVSEELSLRFFYPGEWGEVQVEIETADEANLKTPDETEGIYGSSQGSYLLGTFTKNDNVFFGGTETNYYRPWNRDPDLLETPGFVIRDGDYYEPHNYQYPIDSAVLESTVNTQALMVKKLGGLIHGSHIRAEINLANPDYKGVTFVRYLSGEEENLYFSEENEGVLEQVTSEFLEFIRTIERI